MLAAAFLLLAASPELPADDGGEPTVVVLHVGKVLTVNATDEVFAPGMVVLEDGKLSYVGPIVARPDLPAPLERFDTWAVPGFVDLHTHIHTGSFSDINDMVHAVNPELRAACALVPENELIQMGRAGGTTTLFGIPGSGTNMGGFGVVYKPRSTGYSDCIVRDPGGLKVAQDSNPQNRNRTDVGVTRSGMEWNLRDVNDRARALPPEDSAGLPSDRGENGRPRIDPALRNLGRVHRGELPVLIHTAGSEGVVNTARMWKVKYGTQAVISHGSFDGWKVAPALAEIGIPVNHGPRMIDYISSREGRIIGSGAEFVKAGVPLVSLNTDSSVIPQELFFLQGAMSARYGADPYTMLRALTIHPAMAFGLDDRVGSLEVGKDADVVLFDGDPLDARSAVRSVYVDGQLEYDRDRDGQLY